MKPSRIDLLTNSAELTPVLRLCYYQPLYSIQSRNFGRLCMTYAWDSQPRRQRNVGHEEITWPREPKSVDVGGCMSLLLTEPH